MQERILNRRNPLRKNILNISIMTNLFLNKIILVPITITAFLGALFFFACIEFCFVPIWASKGHISNRRVWFCQVRTACGVVRDGMLLKYVPY